MDSLIERVTLERTGAADASVGMISLPLPRELASDLIIDHPRSGMQPVGWWKRDELPRRVLAFVLDDEGVPDSLSLRRGASAAAQNTSWSYQSNVTFEKLDYKSRPFEAIDDMRGVPAEECTTVEGEVQLTFGGRTIAIQCGATGTDDVNYRWQNVQVDPLWSNPAAQAIRLGGIIYNADTFLWADLYMILFGNGVVHVAAHFVNAKLHIKGYDFQGLPFIRIHGDGIGGDPTGDYSIPVDGLNFDAGAMTFNFGDSATLCSAEEPGTLTLGESELLWRPVSRTYNPWVKDAPPTEWPVGCARTFRFQFSLSDVAPVIARYRAPAWWYTTCGEPWGHAFLPVRGRYHHLAEQMTVAAKDALRVGRFDAGFGNLTSDGEVGSAMMINYYLTGNTDMLTAALDFGYFWNDLHVDHSDFTVRQHLGGFGWKTCAYTKFHDLIYAYLETGDPHLLDTSEMVADTYYAWFRSNWPRSSIGRDNFELVGLVMLGKYFDSDHAHRRARELLRMNREVIASRGNVGGQMGGGPHPGHHPSLYMTGITLLGLLEVAESMIERGETGELNEVCGMIRKLHDHYLRDDMCLFPSNLYDHRPDWDQRFIGMWVMTALRLYAEWPRISPDDQNQARTGWDKIRASGFDWKAPMLNETRANVFYINPWYADAMLIGAGIAGDGIELALIGRPEDWPQECTIHTPFGDVTMTSEITGDTTTLRFQSSNTFPVTVRYGETAEGITSNDAVGLTTA